MARRTAPARSMNPLLVIGAFITLSEAVAGLAATAADGWVRVPFVVFAVTFPFMVMGCFFTILWKRPHVLYAPADYPAGMAVADFVEAVAPRGAVVTAFERSLRRAVTSVAAEPGKGRPALDEVVATATAEFLGETVSVATEEVAGAGHPAVRIFVDDSTTVSDLLDRVYFALAPAVPTYTYGERWVLADQDTGKVFEDIGRRYDRNHSGPRDDVRPVTAVGIRPGMRLAARPLPLPATPGPKRRAKVRSA